MPFKRIKKNVAVTPKSTLDIIKNDGDIIASDLAARANTGDVLIYANDLKQAPDWNKICAGTGGKASFERRLPIIHIAVIIKDPPLHVLEYYDMEPDPDGLTTYVFEGVRPHARIMYLKDWIKFNYSPEEDPGHQCLWRRRVLPIKLAESEELWQWIKDAKALPYALGWQIKEMWQGFFFMFVLQPNSFTTLITIITSVIRNAMLESLGPGSMRKAVAYMASWFGGFCVFCAFTTCLVYFGIPLLFGLLSARIAQALQRESISPYTQGYGVNPDGSLKFMVCSIAVGETIHKMGLLDEENGSHPTLFLPKDFLPDGVGGSANLLDLSLKKGVLYSDNLTRIANPFGPPTKRQYNKSMFVATGQATRTLRRRLAMARVSMAYDLHEMQRDLAQSPEIKNNSILRNTILARKSVFIESVIEEEEEEEDEPIKEDEPKKDD